MARRDTELRRHKSAENQKMRKTEKQNSSGYFLPENCARQRTERSARLRGASPCNIHSKEGTSIHRQKAGLTAANRIGLWPIPSNKKRLGLEVRTHAIMHWKRRHIKPSAKRAHHALMAVCKHCFVGRPKLSNEERRC